MSWGIVDEFIDLAQSRHVAIFRNRDTGAEHHLIHSFTLTCCPTCGEVKADAQPVDFQQKKVDTLASLQAHHRMVLRYRESHANVRLGSKPK